MSGEPGIDSSGFCELLGGLGFDLCAGVPCSIFTRVITTLEASPAIDYLPAPREDTAVGIAVGAYLAGRVPLLLMQNSGLGVCMNALTSLAILYRVPLLMLISWRGYQGRDAPEHLIMGRVLPQLLETIGVPYRVLEPDHLREDLQATVRMLHEASSPVAAIVRKGVLV